MQVSRNKSKYKGIKRIFYSAKYALDGLIYAYRHEHSLWIHGLCSILAVTMDLIFKIKTIEWYVILISLTVILAFELVNTAMEASVDMVTLEYDELARIAKDCCSAATFVMSLAGIIIMSFIFVPHIISALGLG